VKDYSRALNHKIVLVGAWLGLAGASGCGADTVSIYEVECDDDAIGWELDLPRLVELPLAEFGVECASGWGHGVETRAASEVVELPNAIQTILPHPQGGLLLSPEVREALWTDRLGIEVAEGSLAWLDEQAEQVHWLRDDLDYGPLIVVSGETGTELWAWGFDEEQRYLSRIEPSTGELLERVVWTMEPPMTIVAAWPEVGGLWQMTRESHDEDSQVYVLQRMSSFAELGPVLRSFEGAKVELDDGTSGFIGPPGLNPTPGGGLLYGYGVPLESLAEDGSQRWVLDEPHGFRVVDEHGGFLLGNVDDGGGPDDQRIGLTLQRRSLDDGSLLWSRVHHRYEFAHEPAPDEWLIDIGWSYVARAEGGYLIAGVHAYPAASCPYQPILWAIDPYGEVEWAHRVEACGDLYIPDERVEGRAMVLGFSFANGDLSNGGTTARWLQYFDL
jgi:hypothetical protein